MDVEGNGALLWASALFFLDLEAQLELSNANGGICTSGELAICHRRVAPERLWPPVLNDSSALGEPHGPVVLHISSKSSHESLHQCESL